MAQPNFQRVADCLTTVQEECRLIPNMPALQQYQNLTNLIGELRLEMRNTAAQTAAQAAQAAAQTATQIADLRGDIASLRNDLTSRLDAR